MPIPPTAGACRDTLVQGQAGQGVGMCRFSPASCAEEVEPIVTPRAGHAEG